jgi:hypothetical protein
MTLKVFISSTYEDLKEYRQAAIEVVNRYKCVPLAMEFFDSQPGEPEKVCAKEIQECNIFFGIYAHRYGFIPDDQTKSITQLEYELAKEWGKDCLCFIVDEDFPWKKKFMEFGKQKELDSFLDKVKKENVCSFFTTVKDFESKISTSLGKLIAEKIAGAEPKDKEGASRTYIPLAPAPFIAHPYPLPLHFTGRDAEQALLSNWLFNEEEPVLVMEAIGGIGKSALTWVWLHKQVLEPGVEIEGVFWWSFYEASFEVFIQQLACYVLGKEEDEEKLLYADLVRLQAALHQRRFLLVLDGLERALRGYSGMEAMFIQEKGFQGSTGAEAEWEKRQREPVHPLAARFLPHLASSTGKTKTLITTRLMPAPLEGLTGVRHVLLKGLSSVDAVRFLRSEGVKGTRAELEQAGNVYDFHPLMLKLLASSIKRSRSKDIRDAFRLHLIDSKEPQKILTTGFNLLSQEERQVGAAISVFRGVFTFESAKALFPNQEEDRLWQVMQELQGLGFLFFDQKENRFDFHPIIRSFLYHRLTNRAEIHTLAVKYFQALPKEKKIVSLEDLAPVIELYYHLVKSEKFDEAYNVFFKRLENPIYYQFSAYYLIIELLNKLFIDGQDKPPRPSKKSTQVWVLNALANSYTISGQSNKAIYYRLLQTKLHEEDDIKETVAYGLANMASNQLFIGQLIASSVHCKKSIALFQKIKEEAWETFSHLELAQVLIFKGKKKTTNGNIPEGDDISCIEDEFTKAINILKKSDNRYSALYNSYCSFSALLKARMIAVMSEQKNNHDKNSYEALKQARDALHSTKEWAEKEFPVRRYFVLIYWLLAEALIQCRFSSTTICEDFTIPFYDEYFQQQVNTISVQRGNELDATEHCLHEALQRCRKTNMIFHEPDILLTHARLEWAKISLQPKNKCPDSLPSIEKTLKEAFEIAQRAGYRLKLADLHLFCGQVLVELKEKTTLLGLNAYEHLQKTKEYALDVSEFSHLYQSLNPDFYKGIPEYEMLKRGMTEEERIHNGYYVAYRIAEELILAMKDTK